MYEENPNKYIYLCNRATAAFYLNDLEMAEKGIIFWLFFDYFMIISLLFHYYFMIVSWLFHDYFMIILLIISWKLLIDE